VIYCISEAGYIWLIVRREQGRNPADTAAFSGSDLPCNEDIPMRCTLFPLAATTLALVLAGCGQTIEQRAATGAVAGAVVAGPVGAAVGGAAGAAVGQADKPD
jgi:hypothetical protein